MRSCMQQFRIHLYNDSSNLTCVVITIDIAEDSDGQMDTLVPKISQDKLAVKCTFYFYSYRFSYFYYSDNAIS